MNDINWNANLSRKICEIEAYTPTDNVSEFSARINDDGWNTSFLEWLKISKLSKKDAIFILSVGGGNRKKKVSLNLVEAIKYAKKIKSGILNTSEEFSPKYNFSITSEELISISSEKSKSNYSYIFFYL